MYSHLSRHSELNTQSFCNDSAIIAMEKWEHIQECKKRFLEYGENPLTSPYMRRDVAESWLRSHKYGVNPYSAKLGNNVSASQLQTILRENQLLIETTTPLFKAFIDLAVHSGYTLTLRDHQGILMLQEGNSEQITTFNKINSVIGANWPEEIAGTNAHILCMRLKRPIQLLGPENYALVLQDNLLSAAPIFNANNQLIGTLILAHDLVEYSNKSNLNKLQAHSLGWVTSMALAIEQQMSLKQANHRLTVAKNTLEATISFIDEGIIMVDSMGKIIQSNHEGLHMLQISLEETENYSIFERLNPDSMIIQAVKSGTTLNYMEETMVINQNEQTYIISTRPVFLHTDTEVAGAVLRLSHVDKINALVARRTGNSATFCFADIIGNDEATRKTKLMCQRFSTSPENILLMGESGTGKELFAQSIHNFSRPNGPFIAINCAAMPRNLIESELFGYEGGSFTGSERGGRPGKIELASGGTLFLDEIGDMPFEIQAVLLRVLEDKKVMRVGGKRYQPVDFRLVAATNKDLYKMVEEKTFREDLYFRLSVLKLQIPPLRERSNDILVLARHFIQNYCRRVKLPIPQISDLVFKIVSKYSWPGNVRQLENAMIYAVNMAQGNYIYPEHLPEEILRNKITTPTQVSFPPADISIKNMMSLRDAEILFIRSALSRVNNNVVQAADFLNISKSTLYRKIKEYGIET
ncbi:MAG: modulated sigma54 specific transcriptional regulator, Fis family [Firmicutes bacterium]|nr:modulated sigma54 specific transcriptional regulator, Fis family [Bacillota bacterium]